MLTNYQTMNKRVAKMAEYQRMKTSGEFDAMPKREALSKSRELDKLEKYLSGIRNMERQPDAVFILDTQKEATAVPQANKPAIPIVALVATPPHPPRLPHVPPGHTTPHP